MNKFIKTNDSYYIGIGFVYIKFSVDRLLENFLIKNNYLDEFINNVIKSKIRVINAGLLYSGFSHYSYLTSAFPFDKTDDPNHWHKLHNEFVKSKNKNRVQRVRK